MRETDRRPHPLLRFASQYLTFVIFRKAACVTPFAQTPIHSSLTVLTRVAARVSFVGFLYTHFTPSPPKMTSVPMGSRLNFNDFFHYFNHLTVRNISPSGNVIFHVGILYTITPPALLTMKHFVACFAPVGYMISMSSAHELSGNYKKPLLPQFDAQKASHKGCFHPSRRFF